MDPLSTLHLQEDGHARRWVLGTRVCALWVFSLRFVGVSDQVLFAGAGAAERRAVDALLTPRRLRAHHQLLAAVALSLLHPGVFQDLLQVQSVHRLDPQHGADEVLQGLRQSVLEYKLGPADFIVLLKGNVSTCHVVQ